MKKKLEEDLGDEKRGPPARQELGEALERLVRLYYAWGKAEEAARWRKEVEDDKARQKR
jgi:hypothetical protein